MDKYKKLEKHLMPYGTRIIGLTATLVKRTKKKAMYLRSDGYYEVFKIQVREATRIFNTEYPAMELYPNNESFGDIAFCTKNLELAEEYYKKL